MTVFGQTILNGGRYGDARILSPAAVAAMTRDQIPGLRARLVGKEDGARLLGLRLAGRVADASGSTSTAACSRSGRSATPAPAGQSFWIDREHELVGAYFEVTTRVTEDCELLWNFDLFQNAITAAVDD